LTEHLISTGARPVSILPDRPDDGERRADDLHDVSRCPLGHRCESCGIESGDLAVEIVEFAKLGSACFTLCRRCTAFDDDIPITVRTAVMLVEQHAMHVRGGA
jgi:hypothetical protein